MTNNPKHEPVSDHDKDKRQHLGNMAAHLASALGALQGYGHADTAAAHSIKFVQDELMKMYERAAVKPVQVCDNKLESGVIHYCGDTCGMCVASTGNTERPEIDKSTLEVLSDAEDNYTKLGKLYDSLKTKYDDLLKKFSSSPLSEERAVEIMATAMQMIRGDFVTVDASIRLAKTAYRALLPHLSNTSAEKARVEGLVEALTNIACFRDKVASADLEKDGSFSSFDEPNGARISRAALAAFKKGE